MKREDFEAMGDRQKAFEKRRTDERLMPGLPVIVRLDGRAFHTFTRGLARPYDERLSRAMAETAKYMVAETHANMGYTQSDEITLGFANTDPTKPMLFDGKVSKLLSVLAAMATAKFNDEIRTRIPEKAKLLPLFDARVYELPTMALAVESFVWREADATRNSLTMAAHAYYSHKELHRAGFALKHDMLHAKGVNWADYPAFFKRGTFVRRETVERLLTEAELARIPEKHRPTGPVMRSELRELDMPPLSRVTNLVQVLFEGAAPMTAAETAANVNTETPED